jgi:hypothetical protein
LAKEIAVAAQDFGMFIVDQGGGGISVVTQNAPTSPALANWSGPVQSDLNTIFAHAELIQS